MRVGPRESRAFYGGRSTTRIFGGRNVNKESNGVDTYLKGVFKKVEGFSDGCVWNSRHGATSSLSEGGGGGTVLLPQFLGFCFTFDSPNWQIPMTENLGLGFPVC